MHLMLFDLEVKGHHANYIRYIISYWKLENCSISLTIVVSPEFAEKFKDLIDQVDKNKSKFSNKIRFQAITQAEISSLIKPGKLSKVMRRLKEWQLLCSYAKQLKADHCLVMFIDKLQIPIILGLQAPCPYSGIYFRPSFHYQNLSKDSKIYSKEVKKGWFEENRDSIFLYQLNRSSSFASLFTLDPYAASHIKHNYKNLKCTYLPDPIEQVAQGEVASYENTPKGPNTVTFIVFGYLDNRKGISKILDAVEQLPTNSSKKIRILLVGQLDKSLQTTLPDRLQYLSKTKSVKFITDFNYVTDQKIYSYFAMSDVALAVYQNHVGMSGILLTAAVMQKPVLSQDYGLMGKLVREGRLGMTVDSTNCEEIARAIQHIISTDLSSLGDKNMMRSFVEDHSPSNFSKILVDYIK